MAYLVKIFARAERNLADLYGKIDAAHSDAASRWYEGLRDAILSLEAHPNRCPVTPENAELRHLLYGHKPHIYRVLFRVVERQKRVEVLHVRHGARQEIKASDLI
jgi:plasmid stabilization system protein ParE